MAPKMTLIIQVPACLRIKLNIVLFSDHQYRSNTSKKYHEHAKKKKHEMKSKPGGLEAHKLGGVKAS